MKKNILLTVLILALAGAAGYFFRQNYQLTHKSEVVSIVTPGVESGSSTTETTGSMLSGAGITGATTTPANTTTEQVKPASTGELSAAEWISIRKQGLQILLKKDTATANDIWSKYQAETDPHKKLIYGEIGKYYVDGPGACETEKIGTDIYSVKCQYFETIQQILDTEGNQKEWQDLNIKIPNTIMVGDIMFINPHTNFEKGYPFRDNTGDYTPIITMENAYQKVYAALEKSLYMRDILVKASVGGKEIYVKYDVSYPFKDKLIETQNHIFGGGYKIIGNKKNNLNIYVKNPTPITDLQKSQTIFENYFGPTYIGTTEYYEEGKNIATVQSDILPLFGYYPINDDYSMIYIANSKYHMFDPDGLGKPVIYVYDNLEQKNTVSITTKGQFTLTIPSFTYGTSREFQGSKNGGVKVANSVYPYLRYKVAYQGYRYNTQGRFVKGSNIGAFFREKLTTIGLNQQEQKDFMDYRMPKYKANKEYFVSFKLNDQLNPYVKLEFAKKPTSMLRVMMESTQIDTPTQKIGLKAANDNMLGKYERSGIYDLVERGGTMRADGNETIFWK